MARLRSPAHSAWEGWGRWIERETAEYDRFRVELDSIIVQFYGLIEDELANILMSSLVADQSVEDYTLAAYHTISRLG